MSVRVSVIVPAYNVAPYLRTAVESALGQTEPNVEVIIVDDGSTDGTLAVATELAGPRVRVLTGENRGASAARNRAIDAAQGEWVAVLDADDWYTTDRLERLLEAAYEEAADIVIDDQYLIHDGALTPFTTQFGTSGECVDERRLVDPVAFVQSDRPGFGSLRFGNGKALMRRSFLDAQGLRYDERATPVEDSVLYVQCLARGARFVVVPGAYYYRRKWPGAITADLVRLIENDVAISALILNEPQIRAMPRLAEALRDRLAQARSHLAFQRILQSARTGAFGTALAVAARHPAVIPFGVRKLAYRLTRPAPQRRRSADT